MEKHTISFKNAFNGLIWAFKTQPNYKIHFAISIFALLLGYSLHISYFEFLIILVLILIGIVIETLNTAIEATTDAINKEWREDIKVAKDLSAAAMLIFSAGSLLIACIIYIPKIINFVNFR